MEHGLVGTGRRCTAIPWDELTYVLDGEMEFTVGTDTRRGGPGTLGSLPREVGEVYATGPTLERLVEVAGRHGVRPAFDLPGA